MDVVVCEPLSVLPRAFELWAGGASAAQCSRRRYTEFLSHHQFDIKAENRDLVSPAPEQEEAARRLFRADTEDQYRLFEILEASLQRPDRLKHQMLFRLSRSLQLWLIEKYYGLDTGLVGDLLGKKLSTRLRKEMDEVSASTGIPLRSCRRQFDNLQRMMNVMEETPHPPGTILEHVFRLPAPQATTYLCVLFLQHHRFQLGAARRKLRSFATNKAYYCALMLFGLWGRSKVADAAATLMTWLVEDPMATVQKDAARASETDAQGDAEMNPLLGQEPALPSLSALHLGVGLSESSTHAGSTHDIGAVEEVSSGSVAYQMHQHPEAFLEQDSYSKPVPLGSLPRSHARSLRMSFGLATHLRARIHECRNFELDKRFLNNLREVRNYLQENKAAQENCFEGMRDGLVAYRLNEGSSRRRTLSGPQPSTLPASAFKASLKGILIIGANLGSAKELRDLFEDLLSRVADPLQDVASTAPEICAVLEGLGHAVMRRTPLRQHPSVHADFLRFLLGIQECLRALFSSDDDVDQTWTLLKQQRATVPARNMRASSDGNWNQQTPNPALPRATGSTGSHRSSMPTIAPSDIAHEKSPAATHRTLSFGSA